MEFTFEDEVSVGFQSSNNLIEYFVKDAGIGIESEDWDLVFDRFLKIELRKYKTIKGTGLGLSISKAYTHYCW